MLEEFSENVGRLIEKYNRARALQIEASINNIFCRVDRLLPDSSFINEERWLESLTKLSFESIISCINPTNSEYDNNITDVLKAKGKISEDEYNSLSYDSKIKFAILLFRNVSEIPNLINENVLREILKDFLYIRLDEQRAIDKHTIVWSKFEALSAFHPIINATIWDRKRWLYPDFVFREIAKLDVWYRLIFIDHLISWIPRVGSISGYEISINVDHDLVAQASQLINDYPNINVEVLETHAEWRSRPKDILESMT